MYIFILISYKDKWKHFPKLFQKVGYQKWARIKFSLEVKSIVEYRKPKIFSHHIHIHPGTPT